MCGCAPHSRRSTSGGARRGARATDRCRGRVGRGIRAQTLAWNDLERVYLDELADAPREAIASAANGAFIWEAVYRLGWVASQLAVHPPRLRLLLARVPGLRALERVGDSVAVYAAWQAMFADFEHRVDALIQFKGRAVRSEAAGLRRS